jgi:hypothetical protein
MDLSFDVTLLGGIVLVVGAVLFAALLSVIGEDRAPYGAVGVVVTGVATFLGAFIASEYMTLDAIEPVWEGVALLPALLGGALVGGGAEFLARTIHSETSVPGPHPI